MMETLIRVAGVGLLLIVVANFLVPRVFRYRENIARCDRFFGQVFVIHAAYIIYTVLGMGLLCLWRPEFFLTTVEGRAMAGFMGVFWGARVMVQFFYYDREMMRRYPFWSVFFGVAFGALGGLFLLISCKP
ncbi:MAG: hypothetical protein O3A92_10485 [Verrucomicrobia bacterium]|nr:hypothetical protein [Verrucomicrobiota bacterium]